MESIESITTHYEKLKEGTRLVEIVEKKCIKIMMKEIKGMQYYRIKPKTKRLEKNSAEVIGVFETGLTLFVISFTS
jgi:hypothetical protein